MSAKDQILAKPIKKAKPIASPTPLPKQQEEAPVGQAIDKPKVDNTHLSDEARNVEKIQGAMSDVGVKSPTYDPNVVKVDRPTSEETFAKNANLYHKWLENGGLTEEERKKRDKSRAIRSILAAVGDGVSAIVNLHGTTKYAPNMQLTSSLKSLQDRWDKEDKEGKEAAQKKLSLYQQMQAAKRAEDEIKHRRDREALADERYDKEFAYRKQKDREDREVRAEAARLAAEQWQKTFDQNKKVHEDNLAERKRNNNMVNARVIATAEDKNTIPVFLSDTEEVRIPKHIWNNKDRIAEVYEALPDALKEQAVERYATKLKYDHVAKKQLYKPMTWQQMQQAVGAFIADPEATKAQDLARRLAGEATKDTRGLGWGATSNTTDDSQTDW